ncbi:MAG TPA: hypothetical protein GX745_04120 [Clostridiales bacterium]|nr:hypothetical protein [Clostridiales bacterium]
MFVVEDIAAVEFIENPYGDGSKIIGTTLTNYAMPFLRYDTNDIATFRETPEGRQILTIDGRSEDYIILKDGSKVGRLDHIFKELLAVKEAQIVQPKAGEAIFNIVRGENYTDIHEQQLLKEIYQRLGDKIEIKLNYVSSISRTQNGKLRFVISKVKEN